MITRIRGYALPSGEYVDLYGDGDRWTTDPVPGATRVGEGWLVPGLVDAHTHPGAAQPGQPMDDELLREQLHQHVDAGVTLIRSPACACWRARIPCRTAGSSRRSGHWWPRESGRTARRPGGRGAARPVRAAPRVSTAPHDRPYLL
ncbi:hypothetical protein [Amycolatopsis sp. lyj-346]|uniref:hypothetical protein n=1 Tax=Amycolatopsis sp. lyj-346 TaxID=2789289 RepID=UPI0039782001